jgi:hypothetical protein
MTFLPAQHSVRWCWPIVAGTIVWLVLLTSILALPYVWQSPSPGDDLIRNTVRLSLLYYAAAVALMMFLRPADWTAQTAGGATARWFWTLAWAAFLVHVVTAFHYAHHWSHADAVRHTEEVSGFGLGIYFSHLFTLFWSVDVFIWWLLPLRYAGRHGWVDLLLHGFMVFMIFNGMIVFEEGGSRWAGIVMFAALAVLYGFAWVTAKGMRKEPEGN